jgi:hypothetical protein
MAVANLKLNLMLTVLKKLLTKGKQTIRGKRKCARCRELSHGESSYKCALNGTKKRKRKPRNNTIKAKRKRKPRKRRHWTSGDGRRGRPVCTWRVAQGERAGMVVGAPPNAPALAAWSPWGLDVRCGPMTQVLGDRARRGAPASCDLRSRAPCACKTFQVGLFDRVKLQKFELKYPKM